MLIESQIPEPFIARPFVFFRAVAGGYLETMGMRLIRGRSLKRRDVERQEPNIVVKQGIRGCLLSRRGSDRPAGQVIHTAQVLFSRT